MVFETTWTNFKSIVDAKSLRIQAIEDVLFYRLYAYDGPFGIYCVLNKDNSADTADYEDNYSSSVNSKLEYVDLDGAKLVNPKLASSGRTYQSTFFNFATADLDSLFSKDWSGSDLSIVSLKLYDADGDEITDSANEGDAVATVLTVTQDRTFDLQGFCLYQKEQPSTDIYTYAAIAPHIPKAYGGTVELIQSCNLKYSNFGNREVDWVGDSASTINYDDVNYSHILSLKLIHAAGIQHHLQAEIVWYV